MQSFVDAIFVHRYISISLPCFLFRSHKVFKLGWWNGTTWIGIRLLSVSQMVSLFLI